MEGGFANPVAPQQSGPRTTATAAQEGRLRVDIRKMVRRKVRGRGRVLR